MAHFVKLGENVPLTETRVRPYGRLAIRRPDDEAVGAAADGHCDHLHAYRSPRAQVTAAPLYDGREASARARARISSLLL